MLSVQQQANKPDEEEGGREGWGRGFGIEEDRDYYQEY
jgi:hypothetical protein